MKTQNIYPVKSLFMVSGAESLFNRILSAIAANCRFLPLFVILGLGIWGLGLGTSSAQCPQTYTDTIAKILHDSRNCIDYPIEKIGNQWWMTENLNYGTYAAVTSPQVSGTKFCQNLSGVNDPTCPFGGLYEWDNLMQGAVSCNGTGAPPNDSCSTPVQGLCPSGWHVPSHYEWTTLEKNAGTNPGAFPYDIITGGSLGTDEGGNMKVTPICGSLPCWNSPNTGATNSSGFTALPGGISLSGSFNAASNFGYWWSSTGFDAASAWSRRLYSNTALVHRFYDGKAFGFSVRCVKDIGSFDTLTIIENLTGFGTSGLKIYPNPGGGLFTVEIMNDEYRMMNTECRIYNVLGMEISIPLRAGQNSTFYIDLKDQPAGIYHLQVITDKGIANMKVVIE